MDWVAILGDIAVAMSPLLVAALGWLAKRLADKIKADVDNSLLQQASLKLSSAVFTVVKELQQVYVDEFKKAAADGKLSDEEKAHLKGLALEKLKSYVSLDELARLFGFSKDSGEAFLMSHVESAVKDVKVQDALAKDLSLGK